MILRSKVLHSCVKRLARVFLPFSAIVDFETALVSVSVSILTGLVFSVFPARAAAQKNVVEILR